MSSDDPSGSFGEVLRQLAAAPETEPRAPLAPGTMLDGAFELVRRIGAGGMGTVYLAHDHQLDRDVAIKVHSAIDTIEATLHEAQLMARFKHPNVVTVFRSGRHEGRKFAAMEYLAGGTLLAWLAAAPRPWRDGLARLVAAGRGLSAAHAAGIVHRDFKPANVLFDGERVCVSDFGLAHDLNRARADRDGPPSSGGTPAYMAPEQRAGGDVGPAADQYAFCVTAWEALYGARPFDRTREAPARFEAILRRGLAERPADRWPSMDALLAALEADPATVRRRRLRLAAIGAVAVLAIGFVVLALTRSSRGSAGATCRTAAEQLAGIWDADRRAAVERAFVASEVPRAADTFQRTAKLLDEYAVLLTDARTEVCEAMREPGEVPADALERRMWCLDGLRGRMRATVDMLAGRVDASLLDRANHIVSGLDYPATCERDESAGEALRPPNDPAARARYDAVAEQVTAAQLLALAGHWKQAITDGEAALVEARAVGHPTLIAGALGAIGTAQSQGGLAEDAERSWGEAAREAARAHDDAALVRIWSDLVFLLADQRSRLDDAERILPVAEAALARFPYDPRSVSNMHNARGRIALARGRFEDALAEMERALEVNRAAFGDDHVRVAAAHQNLGSALMELGRGEESLVHLERALAIRRAAYGEQHESVAVMLSSIGGALGTMGRLDEALAYTKQALALREELLGPDNPLLANTLSNIAEIEHHLGHQVEAEAAALRALAIRRAIRSVDHPDIAHSLSQLGKIAHVAGRDDDARKWIEESLAMTERVLGPDHVEVAGVLFNLGNIEMTLGNLDASEQAFRRARALNVAARGPGHPSVAGIDGNLGLVLEKRGRTREALEAYRLALEAFEKAVGPEHFDTATALLHYGHMLHEVGRSSEARPLLVRSMEISEATFGPDDVTVAEVLEVLAPVDRALGRRADAKAELARAKEIRVKTGTEP